MEKLKFKLKTNDEYIIDVEVPYFIKEDVLNFSIDNNIYRYNINKKILNKENNESIMNIDMINNEILYVYKSLNKEFKLPIDNNKLSNNGNFIVYEYEIKDNNIINIIEITY